MGGAKKMMMRYWPFVPTGKARAVRTSSLAHSEKQVTVKIKMKMKRDTTTTRLKWSMREPWLLQQQNSRVLL